MKWRSVKPKPWEFLWRTSVLGPFQPTPTPSLPGRVAIGGRGLSPAEERPSLRPFACGWRTDMTRVHEGHEDQTRSCTSPHRTHSGCFFIPKGYFRPVRKDGSQTEPISEVSSVYSREPLTLLVLVGQLSAEAPPPQRFQVDEHSFLLTSRCVNLPFLRCTNNPDEFT